MVMPFGLKKHGLGEGSKWEATFYLEKNTTHINTCSLVINVGKMFPLLLYHYIPGSGTYEVLSTQTLNGDEVFQLTPSSFCLLSGETKISVFVVISL